MSFWLLSECFISNPKPLIPSTGLIRFYIYCQFSCDHIYYQKGKKIEIFQFLMLELTISVSDLHIKPIWPPLNFLPVITIIWNYPCPNFQRPTKLSTLGSRSPKLASFFQNFWNGRLTDFADPQILQTTLK